MRQTQNNIIALFQTKEKQLQIEPENKILHCYTDATTIHSHLNLMAKIDQSNKCGILSDVINICILF